MPKETVRGSDYHYIPILPDYEPKFGESAFPAESRLGVVEVGWSKAPTGHVEIGSLDEVVAASLRAEVEKAHAEGDPVEVVRQWFSHSPGFWVNLDRDGVNALIDRLRTARNQAFGKDA